MVSECTIQSATTSYSLVLHHIVSECTVQSATASYSLALHYIVRMHHRLTLHHGRWVCVIQSVTASDSLTANHMITRRTIQSGIAACSLTLSHTISDWMTAWYRDCIWQGMMRWVDAPYNQQLSYFESSVTVSHTTLNPLQGSHSEWVTVKEATHYSTEHHKVPGNRHSAACKSHAMSWFMPCVRLHHVLSHWLAQ